MVTTMMFPRLKSVAFPLLLALLAVLPWPAAEAEPQGEMAILKQGQVVVKPQTQSAMPSVSAKILIPKPPSEVWKAVLEPEHLMDRERKVKAIRVVTKNGNTQDLAYTVTMARALPTLSYVLRHQVTQPNTLVFRRLSGSFRDIQGFWQVTPAENGKATILTYNLAIDPGPLMPRFVMQNLLKQDLPSMMNNVKAAISD